MAHRCCRQSSKKGKVMTNIGATAPEGLLYVPMGIKRRLDGMISSSRIDSQRAHRKLLQCTPTREPAQKGRGETPDQSQECCATNSIYLSTHAKKVLSLSVRSENEVFGNLEKKCKAKFGWHTITLKKGDRFVPAGGVAFFLGLVGCPAQTLYFSYLEKRETRKMKRLILICLCQQIALDASIVALGVFS